MSRKTTNINSSGSIRDNVLVGFYNHPSEALPFEFMTLTDFIAQVNADSEVGDYTAEDIINVPAGSIVATNVQDAIAELDAEKAPIGGITKTTVGATITYDTDEFFLLNSTVATTGNQQASPALRFTGQGWKTDATAESQAVEYRIFCLPVQGAAAPTGLLSIAVDINGDDTFSTIFNLTSAGVLSVASQITIAGSTTALAGLNLAVGVAPSSPVEGDVWYDGTNFKGREDGGTITFGGGATFKSYCISDVGTADSVYVAGWFRAPASDVELTVGGSATQTYGATGDSHAAHAFAVAATNGSFTIDITVTGTHGTLVIDIDGTDYSQVFNTTVATTATDWIATHTAALGGLGTPIVPLTGGAGIISCTSAATFTVTDDSVGMSISVNATGVFIEVSGAAGSLIIDIDGVDYTEVFAVDADTTADNWRSTHTGTLAGLGVPIVVTDGGSSGFIRLISGGTPVYTDDSTGGMSFVETKISDDTIVGTNGNLIIEVDGTDYTQAFNTSPIQTATDFVTNQAGAILAAKAVTVTSSGAVLTFEHATVTPTIVDNSTVSFISHTNAPQASGGVITISGISITDAGVKNDADTEILVADISAAVTDQLFETTKKWLGQITYTISGEAGAAFMFNYGLVKYEDFGNKDFTFNDIEFIMHADANETGLEIEVLHYNSADMTYSAAAFDPMTDAQYKLSTDHGTNNDIDDNFDGGWKRSGIGLDISGSGQAGLIVRVTTAVNNSISYATMHLGVSI